MHRVQGLGFRGWVLGLGLWNSGFRVWGLEFRDQDMRFKLSVSSLGLGSGRSSNSTSSLV